MIGFKIGDWTCWPCSESLPSGTDTSAMEPRELYMYNAMEIQQQTWHILKSSVVTIHTLPIMQWYAHCKPARHIMQCSTWVISVHAQCWPDCILASAFFFGGFSNKQNNVKSNRISKWLLHIHNRETMISYIWTKHSMGKIGQDTHYC